jgi:CCR4-NOT transcriptional regulation complex NOT5 subunit
MSHNFGTERGKENTRRFLLRAIAEQAEVVQALAQRKDINLQAITIHVNQLVEHTQQLVSESRVERREES